MNAEALNAQLLNQLECPVCLETCIPPIYMCRNGHGVCAKCRPNISECSTCRAPGMPNARCVQLEKMAAILEIPCENQRNGCKLAFNLGDMAIHLPKCSHGFACNLCTDWKGSDLGLKDHVRKQHPSGYFKLPTDGCISVWTSVPTKRELHDRTHFRMFAFNDDIFWHEDKYVSRTGIYSSTLRLVSHEAKDAACYYYSMEFKSKDEKNKRIVFYQAEAETVNATAQYMNIVLPASISESYEDGKIGCNLKISLSKMYNHPTSERHITNHIFGRRWSHMFTSFFLANILIGTVCIIAAKKQASALVLFRTFLGGIKPLRI